MSNEHLVDPRTMYYTGKFPKQEETSPQIEQIMNPKPDCGETSYTGHNRLEGRNAFITGGDSGIGRAVAIAFAREGANVAIQYLPGEEVDAEDVRQLIEAEGRQALIISADFRQEGAATKAFEQVLESFGSVDALVLNAAQQFARDSMQELTLQQVKDTFDVKVFSMFEIVKAAENHLEPGSTIVTTTSTQAFEPGPQLMDYAAANSAVSNLTVNLARYFADKGVRVNAVAPGPIWTALQLDDGQADSYATFGQDTLIGRAGQPAELAPLYVFLTSTDSSYITAEIIAITGGKSLTL
ncbi:SDR family oxidoreductase [Fundicoccus culcitae]|uniref:SDR family oxidoreductase n=1 Tax=Fundicoccus culcitae TaxID=2969821 RepID=A0ABY5P9R1_9LACT|nr:SDR family oxidoreductase [Fundicoccus culcitae]UUX35341.1 SDR family oxidoreductase [Fundicoccus culcitae]